MPIRASLVTVGAIGVLNLALLIVETPVANPARRVADPAGDWRRVQAFALYDPAAYAYETGLTHFAHAVAADRRDGAARAAPLFDRSLRLAPADAWTWTMRAWTRAYLGDHAGARAARDRAWRLAPYHAALARERLALSAALGDAATADAFRRAALARDLRMVTWRDPAWLATLTRAHPDLATLARTERPHAR
jgi:tetratricopeptide (TPR) repeat protein